MINYKAEDKFDDRLDPLFNLAGVFVLVVIAFGMGFWMAHSDTCARVAIAVEQTAGSRR